MARKKKSSEVETVRPNATWTYTTEIQINGRHVAQGTELKIAGERGRFRFMRVVNTGEREWVDCWGGPKGSEQWRSFTLEKVKRVHYKNQTVGNLAAVHKAKKKALREEAKND
jgi:hypothetical protein